MFCKKCGSQIPEGAKFCKKCGAPISNNSNINKDHNDKINKDRNGKKKGKFIFKLILVVVILGIVLLCIKKASKPDYTSVLEDESYRLEAPDAAEYFEQNAKIVSAVDVNGSNAIQSENELNNNLTARGFGDYPIISEYSMDGEYYESTEISETSMEEHPIYQTFYVTASGDVWTIFVINGAVMANPVSYNMQSDLGVQVMISESETVTSYDSTTNKFYVTVPDESVLIVKVVERIDAETLESLTFEVIEGL